MEIKRKNIQMSLELATWYEDKAREMGISASSLMVMALQQYVDQQRALIFASGLEGFMKQIEKLKTE